MRPSQAMFYGLCRFWSIEIREPADVAEFELPTLSLYVIIAARSGDRTDDEDSLRSSGEHVVVLDRPKINILRLLEGADHLIQQLRTWEAAQQAASFERRYGPTR